MDDSAAPIVIQLNGKPRELAPSTSVAELVRALGLASEQVAVERNGRVVRRVEHGTATLAAGDVVEVVTLVGGG